MFYPRLQRHFYNEIQFSLNVEVVTLTPRFLERQEGRGSYEYYKESNGIGNRGQRLSYPAYQMSPGDNNAYLPFNKVSLNSLNKGLIPLNAVKNIMKIYLIVFIIISCFKIL